MRMHGRESGCHVDQPFASTWRNTEGCSVGKLEVFGCSFITQIQEELFCISAAFSPFFDPL